jgi:SAM-dependent methyltransferase
MQPTHHNPRKQFDEAVQYAIQITQVYLDQLTKRSIAVDTLEYLEIGPGTDFAPQLVLAGLGARVTLADQYLAGWDADYHPSFYNSFLGKWSGPGTDAVKAVLDKGGYEGVVRLVAEPAERMTSLTPDSFDFVQSNAVLEHVVDLQATIAELARVTRTGGIHAHQIDFRFHRNFDRPLDHLLMDSESYTKFRLEDRGNHGTTIRMPEMIELFTPYFWLWETEINTVSTLEYAQEIWKKLPPDSRYRSWRPQVLSAVSGRLWLMRKDDHLRNGTGKIPQKPNRGFWPWRPKNRDCRE